MFGLKIISKEKYGYLFANYGFYKMDSSICRQEYRDLKVEFDDLNSKFQHMRQSKIFWKNRCRELEEKIKTLEVIK